MTDTASLVLKVDSTDVSRGAKTLDDLAASGAKAEQATNALTRANEVLAGVVKGAAAAFGLYKLAALAQESAMLAARFETMGIVMKVAGNNAGYTAAQMDTYSKALQKSGISMMQSRNALVQLATAHVDLANAQKIGRAAQDLAVVGGINSSDAMARMIHGIKSGETEVLKTMGLNVQFDASYKKLAASIGITTEALTAQQKTAARTSAVLDEAARYTGIYEESMTTAGKAMSSLTRYTDDLKVKLGAVFLPALASAVFGYTDALKAANKETDKLAQDGKIAEWANNVTSAIVALTTATAVYAGVLVAQVVAGATSAAASFISLNVAHGQALAMNIALAKAEQARLAAMIETTAAQVPAIVSELRYVMAMESVAATTATANAMATQRIALQARLAGIEEANVIAESQLAVATARTAEAQALATASGSVWTKTLWGTSVAADVASGAMSKLALAMNVLLAAFVGWEIGTYLYNQFETVRIVGLLMVGQLMLGFEHLKFGAEVAGAAIKAMVPGSESFTTAYARIAAAHDVEVAKIKAQTQAFAEMEATTKKATGYSEAAQIAAGKASDEKAEKDRKAAEEAKKHGEEVKKAAEAYKATQKHAEDFIKSLEKESAELGMNAQQKKLLEAGLIAVTLKTEKERQAVMLAAEAYNTKTAAYAAEEATIVSRQNAADEAFAADQKALEANYSSIASVRTKIEAIEAETFALTHNKEEMREHGLTMALQKSGLEATSTEYIELEKRIRAASDAFGEAKKAADIADAAKKAADQAAKDWERAADQIAQSLTDNIMRGGKSAGELLKDYFRTLVLRPIIQGVVQTGMNAVGMGGSAGVMGVAGNASSLYNAFSGGWNAPGTMYSQFATSGLGASLGLSTGVTAGLTPAAIEYGFGTLAANGASVGSGVAGSSLTGLGSTIGTALPWVAAAAALYSVIDGMTQGETRQGQHYGYGTTASSNGPGTYGSLQRINGPSGGDIAGDQMQAATTAALAQTNSLLARYATGVTVTGYQSALESSEKGRGGVYAGGTLSTGATFGESGVGSNYAGTLYERTSSTSPDSKAAAEAYALDLSQSILQALRAADIGGDVGALLATTTAGVTSEITEWINLGDSGSEAVTRMVTTSVDQIEQLTQVQADALIAAASGGWLDDLLLNLDESALGFTGVADAAVKLAAQLPALAQQTGLTAEAIGTSFHTALTESASAAEAGQIFADGVVGSVYNAMQSGYEQQITGLFMDSIINPVLIAVAMGGDVAAALSAEVVDDAVQKMGAMADAYNALMASPEFTSAMSRLQDATSQAGAAAFVPRQYQPAVSYQPPDTRATDDAARTAADLARDRRALEIQIMELTGDTAGALAAQRALELEGMDASLRPLQQRINALTDEKRITEARNGWQERLDVMTGARTQRQIDLAHDLAGVTDTATIALINQTHALESMNSAVDTAYAAVDTAYAAVQRAVDAERKRLDQARTDANESLSQITSIFDAVTDGARALRGQAVSLNDWRMDEARAYIDMASVLVQSGARPDDKRLAQAIQTLTADRADNYASIADFEYAQLVQAGKLDKIARVTGEQKSVAEQQLDALDSQLTVLDNQLQAARDQIDAINGVDTSVLSVATTIANLSTAISGLSVVRQVAQTPVVQTPVVQTPVVQTPVVQTPVVQTPVVQTPVVQTPVVQTPVVTSGGGAGLERYSAAQVAGAVNFVTDMAAAGDITGIVTEAQRYGVTSAELAAVIQRAGYSAITQNDVLAYTAAQGLPSFATGINAGILPSDTILQAHGGERITPATYVDQEKAARNETNALLSRLVTENEMMRAELASIKNEMALTQRNTRRHADLFENVTEGGEAMRSNVVKSVAVPVA